MHENLPIQNNLRVRMAAVMAPWRAGPAPLMSLAHFVLEASFNFLPVTYVLLIPKLGLSYERVGAMVFLMAILGSGTQPLFGWLSDRGDPRRLVLISLIWSGVLMGLVGFMPTYGALAALLGLASLGSSAFHPPAAALSAQTEATNRGRAMSLFSVGGNLGSALSPALVGLALGSVGLAATTIVIPLTLLTAWLLVRRFRATPPPTHRVEPGPGAMPATTAGSMAALLAMVTVVGARSYYQMAVMTYLPEWLQANGQSLAMAGAALAVFMIAVSLGSLFGGTLADRFGRLPVITVSLALIGVGHLLMMRLSGAPQMAAVTLVGAMIGASFPVTIVLAQEAWPQKVGMASAIVMGLGWMPAGLGAWVVGRVADGSTLSAGLATLIIAPIVGLAAAGMYVALRRRS